MFWRVHWLLLLVFLRPSVNLQCVRTWKLKWKYILRVCVCVYEHISLVEQMKKEEKNQYRLLCKLLILIMHRQGKAGHHMLYVCVYVLMMVDVTMWITNNCDKLIKYRFFALSIIFVHFSETFVASNGRIIFWHESQINWHCNPYVAYGEGTRCCEERENCTLIHHYHYFYYVQCAMRWANRKLRFAILIQSSMAECNILEPWQRKRATRKERKRKKKSLVKFHWQYYW